MCCENDVGAVTVLTRQACGRTTPSSDIAPKKNRRHYRTCVFQNPQLIFKQGGIFGANDPKFNYWRLTKEKHAFLHGLFL